MSRPDIHIFAVAEDRASYRSFVPRDDSRQPTEGRLYMNIFQDFVEEVKLSTLDLEVVYCKHKPEHFKFCEDPQALMDNIKFQATYKPGMIF